MPYSASVGAPPFLLLIPVIPTELSASPRLEPRRRAERALQWLREGVESSLRNLGTDYIDLYQIHWPDEHTPAEETAGALDDLVREGKIRHVGVSNYDVKQMEELARFGRVETLQPPYHMFRREIEGLPAGPGR